MSSESVGVIHYGGPCKVCARPEAGEITAALLAYAGAWEVSTEHPELTYRDVKQHERECLPRHAPATMPPSGGNAT
jgi:hypothetical protein